MILQPHPLGLRYVFWSEKTRIIQKACFRNYILVYGSYFGSILAQKFETGETFFQEIERVCICVYALSEVPVILELGTSPFDFE